MVRSLRRIAAGVIALCAARFAIMLWASLTFSVSAQPVSSVPSPDRPSARAQVDPE